MNLFETNTFLAEKLKQDLNSLYDLPFYEYSMYVTYFNNQIKEKNSSMEQKTIELNKAGGSDLPGFTPANFD